MFICNVVCVLVWMKCVYLNKMLEQFIDFLTFVLRLYFFSSYCLTFVATKYFMMLPVFQYKFLPVAVLPALMIYVGLLGGASYVNIFYQLLHDSKYPEKDRELCINIAALFITFGKHNNKSASYQLVVKQKFSCGTLIILFWKLRFGSFNPFIWKILTIPYDSPFKYIFFDGLGIWLLGYRIKLSCLYLPQGNYRGSSWWLWSTNEYTCIFLLWSKVHF